MIGHDDPRHGTDRGYHLGCHHACCRAAHAAAARSYAAAPNRLVDVGPARRRIESLACLGWSRQVLSARLGRERSYLTALLFGPHQKITTASSTKITGLYDELHDVEYFGPGSARIRRDARTRGAVTPAGWLDVDRGIRRLDAEEKACGCHPHMPNRRTIHGIECMGCGWGITITRAAA